MKEPKHTLSAGPAPPAGQLRGDLQRPREGGRGGPMRMVCEFPALINRDLLPRNSLVVRLGPFEESGHEAEAI